MGTLLAPAVGGITALSVIGMTSGLLGIASGTTGMVNETMHTKSLGQISLYTGIASGILDFVSIASSIPSAYELGNLYAYVGKGRYETIVSDSIWNKDTQALKDAQVIFKGFVARGDNRDITEVFNNGFRTRYPNVNRSFISNRLSYTGTSLPSGGIGTTRSAFIARMFSSRNGAVYIIDSRNLDHGQDLVRTVFHQKGPSLKLYAPFLEREVLFTDNIPPENIVGAIKGRKFYRNDRYNGS